jgi:hypothetical protein
VDYLEAFPKTLNNKIFQKVDDKKMKEKFIRYCKSGNHRNYKRMKKLQVDDEWMMLGYCT